jgi:RNA polymerase sigma-70 factor (ECF subfamily)
MRRLVSGYEFDADRQRDLLQEMHIELWRSLKRFDRRCSLRTWVYRVANNVGADHLAKRRKVSERFVELEALSVDPTAQAGEAQERRRVELAELQALIHRLAPLDRQMILLYLEGASAGEIADVTGLTPRNIATKIHRIKKLLNHNFAGATDCLWNLIRNRTHLRASNDTCGSFLLRSLKMKRDGYTAVRRIVLLIIPAVLASWWGGGAALKVRAMGLDPTSPYYRYLTSVWPMIATCVLLLLLWLAFRSAAKKASSEFEALRQRVAAA